MNLTPESARRWSGLIFLSLAILLLLLGTTVLARWLTGWIFILYWTACFLLTGLAALSGILEILIIRWRSREEQKELIRHTLEEVKDIRGPKSEDREKPEDRDSRAEGSSKGDGRNSNGGRA